MLRSFQRVPCARFEKLEDRLVVNGPISLLGDLLGLEYEPVKVSGWHQLPLLSSLTNEGFYNQAYASDANHTEHPESWDNTAVDATTGPSGPGATKAHAGQGQASSTTIGTAGTDAESGHWYDVGSDYHYLVARVAATTGATPGHLTDTGNVDLAASIGGTSARTAQITGSGAGRVIDAFGWATSSVNSETRSVNLDMSAENGNGLVSGSSAISTDTYAGSAVASATAEHGSSLVNGYTESNGGARIFSVQAGAAGGSSSISTTYDVDTAVAMASLAADVDQALAPSGEKSSAHANSLTNYFDRESWLYGSFSGGSNEATNVGSLTGSVEVTDAFSSELDFLAEGSSSSMGSGSDDGITSASVSLESNASSSAGTYQASQSGEGTATSNLALDNIFSVDMTASGSEGTSTVADSDFASGNRSATIHNTTSSAGLSTTTSSTFGNMVVEPSVQAVDVGGSLTRAASTSGGASSSIGHASYADGSSFSGTLEGSVVADPNASASSGSFDANVYGTGGGSIVAGSLTATRGVGSFTADHYSNDAFGNVFATGDLKAQSGGGSMDWESATGFDLYGSATVSAAAAVTPSGSISFGHYPVGSEPARANSVSTKVGTVATGGTAMFGSGSLMISGSTGSAIDMVVAYGPAGASPTVTGTLHIGVTETSGVRSWSYTSTLPGTLSYNASTGECSFAGVSLSLPAGSSSDTRPLIASVTVIGKAYTGVSSSAAASMFVQVY